MSPFLRVLLFTLIVFLVSSLTVEALWLPSNDVLSDKYKRWLDEEVVYIVAEEERKQFLSLKTDSEREQFMERFWAMRDTDSSTEENEYRLEHYNRVRYANQKFHDGKPGWKTERGRVYIRHGPPDSISFTFGGNPLYVDIENPTEVISQDSNPDRRRNFRLSFTTPESEIWLYRHIDGAQNVGGYFQVIFSRIDPNQLYDLNQTMRHVGETPGLSYQQRLARDNAVMNFFRGQRIGGEYRILYAGEYKFQEVDDFYQSVFHPRRIPTVSITDLQLGLQDVERSPGDVLLRKLALGRQLKEKVESRVFFNPLPLTVSWGSIRAHSGGTTVPLTLGLKIDSPGDSVDILMELTREGRTIASRLDAVKVKGSAPVVYHTALAARPGRYQLAVYASLRNQPAFGRFVCDVQLPDYSSSDLRVSEMLLFQKVIARKQMNRQVSAFQGLVPLYLKEYVLVPASEPRFRRIDNLTVFFEIYNPGILKDAHKPALQVNTRFLKEGQIVASVPQKFLEYVSESGDRRTAYGLSIPLHSFHPGDYTLELEIVDQVLNENVSKQTTFTIY